MNTIAIDIRNDGKNVTLGQEASTSTGYKGLVIGKGTNMSRDIILDLGVTSSVDTALTAAIAAMGWTSDVEAGHPGISVTALANSSNYGYVTGGGWMAVGSNVTFTAHPYENCSVMYWTDGAQVLQESGNVLTLTNVQSSTTVYAVFDCDSPAVHQNALGVMSVGNSITGTKLEGLST